MKVSDILKAKGTDVMTVRPTETLDTLSHRLTGYRCGEGGGNVISGTGIAVVFTDFGMIMSPAAEVHSSRSTALSTTVPSTNRRSTRSSMGPT